MPKIKRPSMKYTVSFNGRFGGEDYGDVDMNTADYEGDDVDELAAEVISGDPKFPMTFRRNKDTNSSVVGWFFSVEKDPEDEYAVAVMVHTFKYF
jgi:hypothetical protein